METNYMQNQFVTYEIALKLKQLGFDEECLAFSYIDKQIRWYFEEWDKLSTSNFGFIRNSIIDEYGRFEGDEFGNIEEIIAMPLYSQVIDWFREKYNMFINVDTSPIKFYKNDVLQPVKYQCFIEDLTNRDIDFLYHSADEDVFYTTYEEAHEQTILKCIELCQKEK